MDHPVATFDYDHPEIIAKTDSMAGPRGIGIRKFNRLLTAAEVSSQRYGTVDYSQPPDPDPIWISLHYAPEQNGTSGDVWSGGSLLALCVRDAKLIRHPGWHGKTVVELGAGTGVAGVMLARMGAAVLSTDVEHAVPLLRYNIMSNLSSTAASQCVALEHLWGTSVDPLINHPLLRGQQPHVILGSDIVYDHEHIPALCKSVEALCGPMTTILFALKWRTIGVLAIKLFLDFLLQPEGRFVVHVLDCGQPHDHYILHCVRAVGLRRPPMGPFRALRLQLSDVAAMTQGDAMPPPPTSWWAQLNGLVRPWRKGGCVRSRHFLR